MAPGNRHCLCFANQQFVICPILDWQCSRQTCILESQKFSSSHTTSPHVTQALIKSPKPWTTIPPPRVTLINTNNNIRISITSPSPSPSPPKCENVRNNPASGRLDVVMCFLDLAKQNSHGEVNSCEQNPTRILWGVLRSWSQLCLLQVLALARPTPLVPSHLGRPRSGCLLVHDRLQQLAGELGHNQLEGRRQAGDQPHLSWGHHLHQWPQHGGCCRRADEGLHQLEEGEKWDQHW